MYTANTAGNKTLTVDVETSCRAEHLTEVTGESESAVFVFLVRQKVLPMIM